MSNKNIFQRSLSSVVNVKKLLGTEKIKKDSKGVKDLFIDVCSPKEASGRIETFEQSLKRLNLTEIDLQKRMRSSLQIIISLLVINLIVLLYGLYLVYVTQYRSFLVCLILALLLGVFTFREHFNYFQMKKRRLGCTLGEWFWYVLRGK